MNKIITSFVLSLLIAGAATSASAQQATAIRAGRHMPQWVSSKGYWVVESNIHRPLHCCVYFYNNENVLVHKETIDGVKLAVNKKSTKMKLKTALELVVDGWTAGESPAVPGEIVAALFRQ